MKRLITILAIMFLVMSVTIAFAADEKTSGSSSPAKPAFMHPGTHDNMEMMMQCPMMKQHSEMKALLREILQLQQRSLTASPKEKIKIREEVADLIKKIDAMPDKMECPMANRKQEVTSDKKVQPGEQPREEAKPPEHKH